MGWRQAQATHGNIQLGQQVKLFKFGGDRDPVTGWQAFSESRVVWATLRGQSNIRFASDGALILGKDSFVIRWAEPWSTLLTGRIYVSRDLDLADADASTDGDPIGRVTVLGRRRFLELEVGS